VLRASWIRAITNKASCSGRFVIDAAATDLIDRNLSPAPMQLDAPATLSLRARACDSRGRAAAWGHASGINGSTAKLRRFFSTTIIAARQFLLSAFEENRRRGPADRAANWLSGLGSLAPHPGASSDTIEAIVKRAMSRAIQDRVSGESCATGVHVEDGVQSRRDVAWCSRRADGRGYSERARGAWLLCAMRNTPRSEKIRCIEITVDLKAANGPRSNRRGRSGSRNSRARSADRRRAASTCRGSCVTMRWTSSIQRPTERNRKALAARKVTARHEAQTRANITRADGAIIGRATVGALTERAAQLGRIEEVVIRRTRKRHDQGKL